MAKKKSKTQKMKKNLKRKAAAASAPKTKIAKKDEVIYNVVVNKQEEAKKTEKKTTAKKTTTKKNTSTNKKTKIAPKEEVIYNVAVTKQEKEVKNNKAKKTVKKETPTVKKTNSNKKTTTKNNTKKKSNSVKKQPTKKIEKAEIKETKKENKIIEKFKNILKNIKTKSNKKIKTTKKKVATKKITKKDLPKKAKKHQNKKITEPKNKFLKILYIIKQNLHIGFNAILIITFIFLFIGFKTTEAFKTGTLIYICAILLFLITIAISYNKYISGKVFTILITGVMILGIYYLNYTYDFINSFNTKAFEDKTYYVVAIDNNLNKSIYNINNKKIGLLKENNKNVERKLNTKLDKITYIEFDDINTLINAFYNQEFRALIITENQYKYIVNEKQNNKKIKVLYEFEALSKK